MYRLLCHLLLGITGIPRYPRIFKAEFSQPLRQQRIEALHRLAVIQRRIGKKIW
jgi:hypothetical protein